MKKHIVYFKNGNIFYFNGKLITKYNFETFSKNIPSSKVYIIFSSESVQQKIVQISKTTKMSKTELKQFMLGEVIEITNVQIQQIKKSFVYNWRIIGEDEENKLYLLYIVPKEEINNIIKLWENKTYKIKNIFWDADILINSSYDLITNEEQNIVFFENNTFYFLAFKNNQFLFQRKVNLSENEDDSSRFQQLVIELKRSYFFVKQQFKFSTTNFTLVNIPNWLNNFIDEIKNEMLTDSLIVSKKFNQYTKNFILELLINNFKIGNKLTSFLPPEIKRERKLMSYSQYTSVFLLMIFIISLYFLYSKFLDYNTSLKNFIQKTMRYTHILKEASKYAKDIKNLENIEIQKKEFEKILEKRALSSYYLKILGLITPEKIYFSEFNINFSSDLMNLKGKVETKDITEKNNIFQKFLKELKESPFFINFEKVDINSFIKTGEFEITIKIKRIENKSEK